jgi:hypothetical protein
MNMKTLKWVLVAVLALSGAVIEGQTSQQGTLTVSVTGSGPLYIEGAINFFRVQSSTGKTVEEKRLDRTNSTSFQLSPGDYVLVGYVRPCDGNCGLMDPPTDECRGNFSIKSGETVRAVRQSTREGSCTVRFTHETPPGK